MCDAEEVPNAEIIIENRHRRIPVSPDWHPKPGQTVLFVRGRGMKYALPPEVVPLGKIRKGVVARRGD